MKSEIALPSRIYQIKVSLVGDKTTIWRRIRVPGKIKLHDLHLVIQAAMGWFNTLSYSFTIQGTEYRLPNPDSDDFADFENSKKTRLGELLLGEKMTLTYLYDFDDDWEHQLLIEKIEKSPAPPPSCVAGEKACPPENIGGIESYEEKLLIYKNKKHPDNEAVTELFGKKFDPEAFDLKASNEAVREFRAMEVEL
jgi:hypothetical protein